MTLDQINNLINQGTFLLALALIAFVLVYYVFGREQIQLSSKKSR